MTAEIEIRIEWLDGPGVRAPELAATWARYEFWIGGKCVTQVESADGTYRRSVYGSLYPLAEWVATNWWALNNHNRPSAIRTRYWAWSNLRSYPWLGSHNFRGAGDGMAWPDLTLVPEGAVSRIVWKSDDGPSLGPLRFVSSGSGQVQSDVARTALADLVRRVLDRLAEVGLRKTELSEEWDAIGRADPDEQEFCRAVARLGFDPFSVDQAMAAELIEITSRLPSERVADFLDNADGDSLATAAEWASRASVAADRASEEAERSLTVLRDVVSGELSGLGSEFQPAWQVGYRMARAVRESLNTDVVEPFDVSSWIGSDTLDIPSGGLQGFVAVREDRCGLVSNDVKIGILAPSSHRPSRSFRDARALGRALSRPEQSHFIMSSARSDDERVAGAFAAELLAPAEGIRRSLDALDAYDEDVAFDAIANYFGVSPLLVKHQVDNQLAMGADRTS